MKHLYVYYDDSTARNEFFKDKKTVNKFISQRTEELWLEDEDADKKQIKEDIVSNIRKEPFWE